MPDESTWIVRFRDGKRQVVKAGADSKPSTSHGVAYATLDDCVIPLDAVSYIAPEAAVVHGVETLEWNGRVTTDTGRNRSILVPMEGGIDRPFRLQLRVEEAHGLATALAKALGMRLEQS